MYLRIYSIEIHERCFSERWKSHDAFMSATMSLFQFAVDKLKLKAGSKQKKTNQ